MFIVQATERSGILIFGMLDPALVGIERFNTQPVVRVGPVRTTLEPEDAGGEGGRVRAKRLGAAPDGPLVGMQEFGEDQPVD